MDRTWCYFPAPSARAQTLSRTGAWALAVTVDVHAVALRHTVVAVRRAVGAAYWIVLPRADAGGARGRQREDRRRQGGKGVAEARHGQGRQQAARGFWFEKQGIFCISFTRLHVSQVIKK